MRTQPYVGLPARIRCLSLCTGIGGLELGLKRALGTAVSTVCYIEREAFCAAILVERMAQGRLCDAPIWDDVATFDPRPWRGAVDIITAGYPCQPFSAAGKRRGTDDPRHIWPHIARIIKIIGPTWVFAENVPGHLSLGFDTVCCDLQAMDYSIAAGLFSAAEVGAPHLRKRLYFLAHANSHPLRIKQRRRSRSSRQSPALIANHGSKKFVANTYDSWELQPQGRKQAGRRWPRDSSQALADSLGARLPSWLCPSQPKGLRKLRGKKSQRRGSGETMAHADSDRCKQGRSQSAAWARGQSIKCDSRSASHPSPRQSIVESDMGMFADGISGRLDDHCWRDDWEHGVDRVTPGVPYRIAQLRALGNAVVPQTAEKAFVALMASHTARH